MQPPMNPTFAPATMTPAVPQFTGVTTVGGASSTPQYAEFDVSKKGGEDALPAMPSWEGADKKKVYIEEEEVEMDQLKKPAASGQNGALAAGAVAAVPGGGISPAGSPGLNRSPYGPPGTTTPGNGYYPAPGVEADPYGSTGRDYAAAGGYGQSTNTGMGQGYGMAGGAMGAAAAGPGRRSPYDDNGYGQQNNGYGAPVRQNTYNNNNGYGGSYDNYNTGNQGYGNQANQGYDSQGSQGYGIGARRSPPNELPADTGYGQPVGGYGQPAAPQAPYGQDRRSPAPASGYNSFDSTGYDSRQYSSPSPQPLRAPPQRQYTRDASPHNVQNDAGFDFGTSAYSRPAAGGAGGYRQPSPVQQQQQDLGYPGYKPYSPVNNKPAGGNPW